MSEPSELTGGAIPGFDELLGAMSVEPGAGVPPSGGAVGALVAALAASLAAAAADCSRSEWDEAAGMRAQALALRRRATGLAERQAAAYDEARQALAGRGTVVRSDRGSPGDTQRDRQRDWRLGAAVERAAVPLVELAAAAADIAAVAAVIADRAASDVRADAVTAALLAAAVAQSAARLVQINLVVGGGGELVARAQGYADDAARAASAAAEIDV
jgi:formiminotetrahydrofolate cyclodeaminase